jgi:hypothetical protein
MIGFVWGAVVALVAYIAWKRFERWRDEDEDDDSHGEY